MSDTLNIIKKSIFLTALSLMFFSSSHSVAQIRASAFLDFGKSNISSSTDLKNSYTAGFFYKKWIFESSIQFDLISNNPRTFTGLNINVSRDFRIGKLPFKIKSYFLLNRFSDYIYETDWGVLFCLRENKHFKVKIGNNTKLYSIYRNVVEDYNIKQDNSILSENFNLLYSFSGHLKPKDHKWNIGLYITNFDYFIMNQSTNPMFSLQGTYMIKSGFEIFSEAWYKEAGIFNISANHFGYTIRAGIKWALK